MVKTKIFLLTGDVGGTNSRMALYDVESPEAVVVETYRNETSLPKNPANHPTAFQDNIIVPFLKRCFAELKLCPNPDNPKYRNGDSSDLCILACLAIAGVVQDNRVVVTNLGDMVVDGNIIARSSKPYLGRIKYCRIINDFVAQGYGCLTLEPSEVRHLYGPRTWNDEHPKVCVGAGTGLGECYLTPAAGSGIYTCFASEGGHVDYNPRSPIEVLMWESMKEKFGSQTRISVERVVSGPGLSNVYHFLAKEYPGRIDQLVHEKLLNSENDVAGKIVAENATPGSLCFEAMEIMMSAYGSEVGSTAVKFIPTGGLFVTGGLTPKNIAHIENTNSKFMQSYLDKGRVAKVLENVPLYAVMVEDLGMRGAHKCAMMEYDQIFDIDTSRKASKGYTTLSTLSNYVNTNQTQLVAIAAAFLAGMLAAQSARRS